MLRGIVLRMLKEGPQRKAASSGRSDVSGGRHSRPRACTSAGGLASRLQQGICRLAASGDRWDVQESQQTCDGTPRQADSQGEYGGAGAGG